MSEIKDKIGQVITPGCYIAYGHALGRCAGIRIGKVLKTEVRKEKRWHTGQDEEIYRVTVWGVDDDWSHRKPELLSKKSTLQFPERMIVLQTESVPENLRKLLDPIAVG